MCGRVGSGHSYVDAARVEIDLPQVDLSCIPDVRVRAKRAIEVAKRPSERRSRERSTCLACRVFICVSRHKL